MTSNLLERLEAWNSRLYGLETERLRREEVLRATLLRRLLVATGAVCLLYIVLELAGILSSKLFPYDALEMLGTLALCQWLLSRSRVSTATTLLVVVMSHPAAFAVAEYGLPGPAASLFLPSLLVCGLLVGGFFLSTWTAICCLVLLWVTFNSTWFQTQHPSLGEVARLLLFWWLLFTAVGWLVHLFSIHLERRWQVERGQKNALGRMLAVMLSEPPLQGLLNKLLVIIGAELGAANVSMFRYEGRLGLVSLVGTTRKVDSQPEKCPSIPASELSIWHELTEMHAVIRITNPHSLGWPALASESNGELYLVPIITGSVLAGFLAINHERKPAYPQEQVELAEILAQQLGLFLQMSHLTERERDAAVVEERNRMAREIHDSLAQGFTGIVVQLNAAEEMLTRDEAAARRHLSMARALARASLNEARRSVWALPPLALDEGSLPAALQRIARELSTGDEVDIAITVTGDPRPLPADVELNILRIGQEAMTNAVRHSQCRRITLDLRYDLDAVRLAVEDNGTGVPLRAQAQGTGLVGMDERARRLGGELQIDSLAEKGTRVSLTVPLR